MGPDLHWTDVALRLALTLVAGVVLGFNRSERGRIAGLCTVTLVCLAGSLAMLQVNYLLGVRGHTNDSFSRIDPMRLPLGILTGVGFIGGGAILQRGNIVRGVTTAATLWIATVLGLCFGGGQIGLGIAGLVLAILVLTGLKAIEMRLSQERHGSLVLRAAADGPPPDEIRAALHAARYQIASWSVTYCNDNGESRHLMRCRVAWRGRRGESPPPPFLGALRHRPGVLDLRWQALD